MLNIDSILQSPVIVSPWSHKIIDNVFDKKDLEILTEAAKILEPQYINGDSLRVWMPVAEKMGVSQEAINVVVNGANRLLENFIDISKDFYGSQSAAGSYFSMPKFELTGTNFEYPIHKDGNDKALTFVVYLSPTEHLGTRIYTDETEASYVGSAEWKVNRAFMICPSVNATGWHNWRNDIEVPRVTLNYTLQLTDSLKGYFDNFQEENQLECRLWLYDQFGKGNLSKTIG